MKILTKEVEKLKNNLHEKIEEKLKEFEKEKTTKEKFLELVFCILVANNSMEKTLEIWRRIGENFLNLSKNELSLTLKNLGYRFYNKRTEYIIEAREKIGELEKILSLKDEQIIREMLVETFKGIGWKEASHFLRNLGYKNFAILDRHVLRILKNSNIIKEIPKTLTKRKYLEIESKLREIANFSKISLAELDMYLFYLSSGKLPLK